MKGVNFYGPGSEYVVSGSDCGNIFLWDKDTEAIVNMFPGDEAGVVSKEDRTETQERYVSFSLPPPPL